MRIWNIHTHEWGKWQEPRPHMWKHYSEMLRYCSCGKIERKVFDLFCPTYQRTGSFCFFCGIHAEVWEKTLVKTEFLCNNNPMEQNKKPKLGRPGNFARNIAMAIEYEFYPLSYRQVGEKHGVPDPSGAFQAIKAGRKYINWEALEEALKRR